MNNPAKESRAILKMQAKARRAELFGSKQYQDTPKKHATYGGVMVATLREPEREKFNGQSVIEYLANRKRSLFNDVISLECETFKRFCQPGVYIFADGAEVFYVGSSRRMLSRVANDAHESAVRSTSEATQIYFLPCASVASARFEETELIKQLRPKYNIVGAE